MEAQTQAGLSHGSAAVPPQPIRWALQGNNSFPPSREHHPALHISAWICVHGRVQPPSNNSSAPSSSQSLEWMSWCLPILILLAPCLPMPSLQAQMLFEGEEAGLSPYTPVIFPMWPMGKDWWGRVIPAVAAYCLDICIPSPCQSSPRQTPQHKISLRPSFHSRPEGVAPSPSSPVNSE